MSSNLRQIKQTFYLLYIFTTPRNRKFIFFQFLEFFRFRFFKMFSIFIILIFEFVKFRSSAINFLKFTAYMKDFVVIVSFNCNYSHLIQHLQGTPSPTGRTNTYRDHPMYYNFKNLFSIKYSLPMQQLQLITNFYATRFFNINKAAKLCMMLLKIVNSAPF